jgi:hypothetical protein
VMLFRKLALAKWGTSISIMNNIIDSEIIIADTIEQQATAAMTSAGPSSKPLSPSEFIGDLPECILIGTLCKQMPKRPSVLDEYKDATLFQPSKAIETIVYSSEVREQLL